jgi:murein DD-endopeptidase MepM/ murein hydrolase activator NlpD
MARRTRRLGRFARFPGLAIAIAGVVLVSATVSTAQLGIFPTPTPKPRATPSAEPTLTPPATDAPTPDPVPSGIIPPVSPTPKPKATKSPNPTGSDGELLDDAGELPDGLDEEFVVPSFPRTRPRNTVELVNTLRALTEVGVPLEQALIDGMGRFPVAGLAHYFDDWLNPRFTPKPHLHHGLDIFADFATPIRAPDAGVVTSLPEAGAGGTAVWVRGSEGTSYYFAHMLERVEGIHVGQRVEIGTVLGFVGDTGNAKGGTPHLHFEIHPSGGEAVPPKPTVDAWLDEAMEIAPKYVEARRAEVKTKGKILGSASSGAKGGDEDIEASMLLTLLDPVGGSVGLLPTLQVQPRRSGGAVSERLLGEIIRQRVAGELFIPSNQTHLFD